MSQIPNGYYLTLYNYGMGGVWWLIKADSAEEIERASKQLEVVVDVPHWMNLDRVIRDDIRNPMTDALRLVLQDGNDAPQRNC